MHLTLLRCIVSYMFIQVVRWTVDIITPFLIIDSLPLILQIISLLGINHHFHYIQSL